MILPTSFLTLRHFTTESHSQYATSRVRVVFGTTSVTGYATDGCALVKMVSSAAFGGQTGEPVLLPCAVLHEAAKVVGEKPDRGYGIEYEPGKKEVGSLAIVSEGKTGIIRTAWTYRVEPAGQFPDIEVVLNRTKKEPLVATVVGLSARLLGGVMFRLAALLGDVGAASVRIAGTQKPVLLRWSNPNDLPDDLVCIEAAVMPCVIPCEIGEEGP